MLSAVELPAGFEVVLGTAAPLDPVDEPGRAEQLLLAARSAGATVVNVRVTARSVEHCVEQLAAAALLAAGLD